MVALKRADLSMIDTSGYSASEFSDDDSSDDSAMLMLKFSMTGDKDNPSFFQ